MSRRASDKTQARILNLLLALAVASSVLAAVVSYKAIRTLDAAYAAINSVLHPKEKSLLPDAY